MSEKKRCLMILIILMGLILPACTAVKMPPIIKATDMGRLNEVNQLLEQGVDPNTATPEGVTPLLIASARGFEKIAKQLIDNGADVNAEVKVTFDYEDVTVYQGATSLLAAAANRRSNIVNMLIARGADVNKSDMNGATPLMAAAAQSDRKVVELLIEKGADLNAQITADYEYAGEPVFTGATALMSALAMKHYGNAALLIANGADVNLRIDKGSDALMIAAANRDSRMVRYLLSMGANPKTRVTEAFVVKGQPVFEGATSLMAAADAGDAESVAALIKAGADVNATTKNGATALMAAASKGHLEAAKVLVANGADVNARTTESFTIGKDPVPKGSSVLGGAAFGGDPEVVQFLVENGAEVNAKDDEYDIDPLFLASMKGHIKVVKILIDNGADVYAETKMGTAHTVALHYGYPYIAQYINDARKKLKKEE